MEGNIISFAFCVMASIVIFVGIPVIFLESHLPASIVCSIRYGKYCAKVHPPAILKLEVPKRWFRHFYIYAAPSSCILCLLVYYKYLWNGNVPEIIHWLLNILLGSSRKALVSSECTLLTATLFTAHCCKRLYETQCVNIFSNANMSITHYLCGFVHYTGLFVCLIGESKGFVKGSEEAFSWGNITFFQLLCAVIFLLSSYAQLHANCTLRNLRRNKDGTVVSGGYKVPHGGLFEYVSGALQITEMLIYVTSSILLWRSSTFHWITFWVVFNQGLTGFLTHEWYCKNFKDYPKTRKAVIPYVF